MHVLFVTNMYPTDAHPASGTFVADQVRSLRETGVQTEVLLADRSSEGRRTYRDLARRVRVQVRSTNPHLVHVMYGGVMADTVTRIVDDRPVLVSFCGADLEGNATNGPLGALSARYGVAASARAARRAAGIVVKSRNLFDALAKSLDYSRVWIVPNGVDLSRFAPRDRTACQQRLGWDPGRKHVLFPAPPARAEKGFPLADAAIRALAQAGLDVRLHALDGVPHEEVPIWLNAADAVVLTSVREGSPNVVKEALACDVPVVSVDVGDVRERLTGIVGCFIADRTPDDLSAKLAAALERGRIDGRATTAELSLERVAARLREIYDIVTRGPSSARGSAS
jgi:teichuronic acid biosynthesis glycosyltransferase TuaC